VPRDQVGSGIRLTTINTTDPTGLADGQTGTDVSDGPSGDPWQLWLLPIINP
jgi:hypothetical protein